jgi:hypothetical protein
MLRRREEKGWCVRIGREVSRISGGLCGCAGIIEENSREERGDEVDMVGWLLCNYRCFSMLWLARHARHARHSLE